MRTTGNLSNYSSLFQEDTLSIHTNLYRYLKQSHKRDTIDIRLDKAIRLINIGEALKSWGKGHGGKYKTRIGERLIRRGHKRIDGLGYITERDPIDPNEGSRVTRTYGTKEGC